VPGKPADALPPVSNLDHREAVAATWGGAAGWTVTDELDPVAHPGERQLARAIRLRPLGDGVLVMTARAPDAATLQTSAAAIDALATAVTFRGSTDPPLRPPALAVAILTAATVCAADPQVGAIAVADLKAELTVTGGAYHVFPVSVDHPHLHLAVTG